MNKSTSTSPCLNFDQIYKAATPANLLDKSVFKILSRPVSVLNSAILQTREEIVRPVSITPTLFKKHKRRKKDADALPQFVYDYLQQDYVPKIEARSKVGDYKRMSFIGRTGTMDITKDSAKSPEFFITELRTSIAKRDKVWTLRKRDISNQERKAEYNDFAIGGNKHNLHNKCPIYKPQIVKFSPRSSIKLYSKRPFPKYQDKPTIYHKRTITLKSIEEFRSGRQSLNQSVDYSESRSNSKASQILYKGKDRSSSSFTEKIQIIKELANFDIDLKEDSNELLGI